MASSQAREFGHPSNPSENYNTNPSLNNEPSPNPSATAPTGSTNSNDPVMGSYGNTHSSTSRSNPIHPSDAQSTAHPAYGNSTFSSPYETAGGNTAQGAGVGVGAGGGEGVGSLGYATGTNPPNNNGVGGVRRVEGDAGPNNLGGGNPAQAGDGVKSTHTGGSSQPPTMTSGTTSTTTGTAIGGVDNRSTGSQVKEMAHGVKGLFAAVHGAGESVRGNFNAGVERAFHEVLDPHPIPFPSLRPLGEYAEDADGEFPAFVFIPSVRKGKVGDGVEKDGGEKGRYPGRRFRVKYCNS
jgi:hypothetical protein